MPVNANNNSSFKLFAHSFLNDRAKSSAHAPKKRKKNVPGVDTPLDSSTFVAENVEPQTATIIIARM